MTVWPVSAPRALSPRARRPRTSMLDSDCMSLALPAEPHYYQRVARGVAAKLTTTTMAVAAEYQVATNRGLSSGQFAA